VQGSESRLDLKLAHILNRHSQTVALELAKQQLAAGQSAAALQTLSNAGEGSEATRLRLGVQLEQGQANAALESATQLAKTSNQPQDLLLAALTFGTVGKRELINPLVPRLTNPEALQRVQRAKANDLLLGTELYAAGLPDSSQRILAKQPSSYERNYLLGQIAYARHDAESLASAEAYTTNAISFNPASESARELIIQILQAEGKSDDAAQQQSLLDQLKNGRI
jgi:hypothetical protein